ncbi:hypothetical protein [Labrys sp. ZIDIC5]|uniref:hypothetical protein n=1 Tax=Labrys sedimenti TaxID=3106036 RepID=UPI002ACA3CDD|nr:hypothetical protein [Labrys sp. ZIDIC5]MDZ5453901.1 hypothetical protein [Labrys sp. ZIDIC5]
MDLTQLPWKDIVTIGAATLGAGLGIMNTWNSMSQTRVRLRVRPLHAFAIPSNEQMFSIEVINLSSFSVTISDVGFSLSGQRLQKGVRATIPQPIIIDGKPWPRRLEAREAVSVYLDPRAFIGTKAKLGKAYARTACGEVAYGDSPARQQLARSLLA